MQTTSLPVKVSPNYTWSVAFLMLFVGGFSLLFLTQQGLRLDEAQSLWQISNSVPRIINIIAQDVHVPLYHLILHFWVFYLGDNIFTARILSLIFSVLTIPFVYILGKKIFNPKIAFYATVLTAVSPFLIWYGSEIRMYSLLTLITVINQIFFVDVYKHGRYWAWLGYGITNILGVFTHYYFILILLAQGLFFLLNYKQFPSKSLRKFAATYFVLGVSFAPWLYYVYNLSLSNYSEPLLIKPGLINIFLTFSEFFFGFQSETFNRLVIALWPIVVLLGFLALSRKPKYTFDAKYVFFLSLAPVAIAFVASIVVRPLYLARYLILTIPSLYLFLAWLFSNYPLKFEKAIKIMVVLTMSVTLLHQTVSTATPVKEQFQQTAEYLNQNVKPDDIIVISAPFTIYPIEYYYQGSAKIITMPEWNRFKVGPIPAFSEEYLVSEVETFKNTHQRVWVVLSYDQGYEDIIRLYFDKNFHRLDSKEFSQSLNLYLYKLRYN